MINVLDRVMGVVVDAVSDVMEIVAEDIMPPPQFGMARLTEHIVGVATRDERTPIVLEVERALWDGDIRQLDLAETVRPD